MSQHYFQTEHKGLPVTVQLGWDRPLQQFYMVIEHGQSAQRESGDEDDSYLYSNLGDPQAIGCKDLDYFAEKLNDLGITVPDSMIREVWRDAGFNVGNRQVTYEKDGTFTVLG
jgi:hypothetical protein